MERNLIGLRVLLLLLLPPPRSEPGKEEENSAALRSAGMANCFERDLPDIRTRIWYVVFLHFSSSMSL